MKGKKRRGGSSGKESHKKERHKKPSKGKQLKVLRNYPGRGIREEGKMERNYQKKGRQGREHPGSKKKKIGKA